ncbi:UNVERIFIED_CONTAM: hypothetical protein GTU68_051866 [Idotea baltica]|nr:hypothetical protein [Idotea baltica]
MTQDTSAKRRRAIGIRACLTSIGILAIFAAFGEAVLGFVGISMPAFRVAGGILLFLTALDMLFERRTKRREGQAEEDEGPDPSVFPLAIPLIAGPGSIATVILLAGQKPGLEGLAVVIGIMIAVVALVFLLFLVSGFFGHRPRQDRRSNLVYTLCWELLAAACATQFLCWDGFANSDFAS